MEKKRKGTIGYRLIAWGMMILSFGLLIPVGVVVLELADLIEQHN